VQQVGVLIRALGVAVVATRGALQSILEVEFNQGDLGMLAACVLYALYTVALRDRPSRPGVAFFALLALIAAITSLPLVPSRWWPAPSGCRPLRASQSPPGSPSFPRSYRRSSICEASI
jgi:drug/metabolite transporter (DMT)-like permease